MLKAVNRLIIITHHTQRAILTKQFNDTLFSSI